MSPGIPFTRYVKSWSHFGRPRPDRSPRFVAAPSSDSQLLDSAAVSQTALAGCDRSPALLRLVSGERTGDVRALFDGELEVGRLPPELATGFRRLIGRAQARGQQFWVHGQVERRDLDLVVVLHCPSPDRIKLS
jgi:hypothetical protein